MTTHKFLINYYFKLGQLDITGRLWLKYYIYNTAENMHLSQKNSNKSCSALNFVQKSTQGHMFIFPQSGARGLESFIWLIYYIYRNSKK